VPVRKHSVRGGTYWRLDEWITGADGVRRRIRQSKIPTRELAVALAAKIKAEAFEGRFFDRAKAHKATVRQLWEDWRPISERDKASWQDDVSRSKHLLEHLGDRVAQALNRGDIDEYRNLRLAETTLRGRPPSPATLDREIALLMRMCSYAVECGRLLQNPLAHVRLLRKPNVRRVVIDEATFARLVEAAGKELRPILVMAYDTGMRKGEILGLRWSQLDLEAGTVRLGAEDTKTSKARTVYLTARAKEAIQQLPRDEGSEHVFVSSRTGKGWVNIDRPFAEARAAMGRPDIWFHDLRRSFVTNARRRGVPESVVMKMSGHRTRSVFDRYNVVEDGDVRAAVKAIEGGQPVAGEAPWAGEDTARTMRAPWGP
jgi:integrase